MFTGIIERTVPIATVSDHPGGRRLAIGTRWGDERLGESIAVNGCCLTVAEIGRDHLFFDVITETLRKTNLGRLAAGDCVHVERALRVSDRVGGHFVLGHVDGTATLLDCAATPSETRLRLGTSAELARYVMPKGSVCLDGVSLTVAAHRGMEFEVALIPTTLERTVLGERPAGWPMNFEADILVKTVVTTLARMAQSAPERAGDTLPA